MRASVSKRDYYDILEVERVASDAQIKTAYRKLGVTNRTQAAMMAVQMGVGPTPGALVIGE